MEPFIDGGLIELFIAIAALGYLINFIFLKKYLLVLFSIVSGLAPVLLFFLHHTALFYLLVALCVCNSILLIAVLWKIRIQTPYEPLFDLKKYFKQIKKKFRSDAVDNHVEKFDQSLAGINEIKDDNFFYVYPNHSNSLVNIVFAKPVTNGNIKLINTMGRTVMEKTGVNSNSLTIDISEQANGIYFIEIIVNGSSSKIKLVKN